MAAARMPGRAASSASVSATLLAGLLLLAGGASASVLSLQSSANSTISPPTFTLLNGVEMPLVGFGTAGLLGKGQAPLRRAVAAGFRHLDTAQADEWYDEAVVGAVLEWKSPSADRDAFFLTTKVHPRNYGYERTLASIDASLARLGTDHIDLVLLHVVSCEQWGDICGPADPERGSFLDAWRALEAAYEQKKVRAIGVSNFDVPHLEALANAATHPVMVVQNWADPLHQDRETRAWCRERGVLYTSYSTLGTQWQFRHEGGKNPVLGHPVIVDIAKRRRVAAPLVVLSWALQEGMAVIPRSSNVKHIIDLAKLLPDKQDVIHAFLTEEELAAINALEKGEEEEAEADGVESGGAATEL